MCVLSASTLALSDRWVVEGAGDLFGAGTAISVVKLELYSLASSDLASSSFVTSHPILVKARPSALPSIVQPFGQLTEPDPNHG